MQVARALLNCWPAGAVLNSTLPAAQQLTAPALQQLWHLGVEPYLAANPNARVFPARLFGSSCAVGSTDHPQQQQQQQQAAQGTSQHEQQPSSSSSGGGSDADSNSGPQQRINVQQEAKAAARGLLAKSLDMEELWFAAVAGQLKVWSTTKHPDLKGREQEVVEHMQNAYYATLQRAATGHILSTRARNQLKQACLAAATYKVLEETLPGCGPAAEQHIMDMVGGLYAPFMLGGHKFSSWVKRLLLRQSSISQAVDTLHNIAMDMEGACHCSVQPLCAGSESEDDHTQQQQQQQGEAPASQASQQDSSAAGATGTTASSQAASDLQLQEHEQQDEAEASAAAEAAAQHHSQQHWQLGAALTVDSCLYADVLRDEGVPQLLKAFCCQHNMSWLQSYDKQGVDSRLEACIGKGDSCCRITVTPSDSS